MIMGKLSSLTNFSDAFSVELPIFADKVFTNHVDFTPCERSPLFNTLRLRQNGRHFTDDILRCIFMNEDAWLSIKILLKFVSGGPNNKIPVLVQIMAWCRPDNKPLSELIKVSLLTHMCVIRLQWVKTTLRGAFCTEVPLYFASFRSTFTEYEYKIFIASKLRLRPACLLFGIQIPVMSVPTTMLTVMSLKWRSGIRGAPPKLSWVPVTWEHTGTTTKLKHRNKYKKVIVPMALVFHSIYLLVMMS